MEFTARDLIDENVVDEGTFEIPLKNGRKIVVRKLVSFRQMVHLRERAADILKAPYPPAWKPFLPMTPKVADMIADFTELVVSPRFKDIEVAELCETNGMLAAYLHGKIKVAQEASVPALEAKELDDAKNDSASTGCDETTSRSAETSTESISGASV